jgi:hypothetical protein
MLISLCQFLKVILHVCRIQYEFPKTPHSGVSWTIKQQEPSNGEYPKHGTTPPPQTRHRGSLSVHGKVSGSSDVVTDTLPHHTPARLHEIPWSFRSIKNNAERKPCTFHCICWNGAGHLLGEGRLQSERAQDFKFIGGPQRRVPPPYGASRRCHAKNDTLGEAATSSITSRQIFIRGMRSERNRKDGGPEHLKFSPKHENREGEKKNEQPVTVLPGKKKSILTANLNFP